MGVALQGQAKRVSKLMALQLLSITYIACVLCQWMGPYRIALAIRSCLLPSLFVLLQILIHVNSIAHILLFMHRNWAHEHQKTLRRCPVGSFRWLARSTFGRYCSSLLSVQQ